MKRQYKEIAFLTNGHTKGITAIEFNSAGTMLATGGLDGKVCLWSVPLGKLLHVTDGNSPVTSLKWVTRDTDTILFGTKGGNLLTLSLSSDFSINGFWAHKYPVEHIAINGDLVASGALSELKVWKWDPDASEYVCEAKLQPPPVSSHSDGKEVLVTSLHWTVSEQHGRLLMVTYMYHGAHLIETMEWMRVRTIPFPGKIARASLSDNGRLIAISNLTKGFDVYRMETEEPVASYEHDVGEPMPTPVLFTHEDRAIVGGSTVGRVNIWDVSVSMSKLFSLSMPRGNKVLAIAVYCKKSFESGGSGHRILIATAAFNQHSTSIAVLWDAQQLGSEHARDEKGASNSDWRSGVDGQVSALLSPSSHSMSFIAKVFWSAGWVILAGVILFMFIDDASI